MAIQAKIFWCAINGLEKDRFWKTLGTGFCQAQTSYVKERIFSRFKAKIFSAQNQSAIQGRGDYRCRNRKLMIEKIYGKVRNITMKRSRYHENPVFGFDTETPNYTPRLLTIADAEKGYCFDVNPENILDAFIDFFAKIPAKTIYCFAHNLQFDMTVLMNQDLEFEDSMQLLKTECTWGYKEVVIRYLNDNPHFGEIVYPDGKKVLLRDTFAFFGRIKLDELAKILKIGSKVKIDKGEFYNENAYKNKRFREYATEDARLTACIGEKILEYHAMYDVNLCVSAPQLAATVFRKNFIPRSGYLSAPHKDDLHFWELSYHGGKNGCYAPAPKTYKDVYLYDINSAYPHAMTEIPNFYECGYIRTKKNEINPLYEGIYRISGRTQCPYNSVFTHDFKPFKAGEYLQNIWITSYELKSLMKWNCLDKLDISAGLLVVPNERAKHNPLKSYAETFYDLKRNTPKSSVLYHFFKIMLNSLYGKFIQRRYDEDLDFSIRGNIYNPAIASLITGHARAHLHEMEHEGKALHCATDSVFTKEKMIESPELGGLSCEGFGDLDLVRTKVYMFYTTEKGKSDIKRGNKYLTKYALHGFHGRVEQLIHLWKKRGIPESKSYKGIPLTTNEYLYQKMPTAGEYLLHKKLNLKMFGMNELKSTINIDWSVIDEA